MAFTTINKSSLHHGNLNFNGTGSTNAKSGFGFAPDFILGKVRNHVYDWNVYDKVRGATKLIRPNQTNAENTESNSVTSFDSDGYTLGSYAGMNDSGKPYTNGVWKAGTTSGLSGGTITPSSYSFNATAGFSIIAYTGTGSAATIPHGLGAAPQAIWVKRLDSSAGWCCYFENDGAGYYQRLNDASNRTSDNNIWNGTAPTTSVFSVGTDTDVNGSSATYVAYCFTSVQGYCRIGRYRGNSSSNGAFIYTGFRPKTIIIKEQSSSKNWWYFNDKRLGYNGGNRLQNINLSDAEQSTNFLDVYSNGFKLRDNSSQFNAAGNEHNYMAWGQTVVGTNNIPGTAY
jgi:hypothetical protein